MTPGDPRTVHYMIPCEEANPEYTLYANYYLAVNCDLCRERRPPAKYNWQDVPTELKVVSYSLIAFLGLICVGLLIVCLLSGNIALVIWSSFPLVLVLQRRFKEGCAERR